LCYKLLNGNELDIKVGRTGRVASPDFAKAKAIAATIKTEAKKEAVNFEIKVLSNGISSEAAKETLASLPSIETLMPKLELSEIENLLDNHSHKEYRRGQGYVRVRGIRLICRSDVEALLAETPFAPTPKSPKKKQSAPRANQQKEAVA
jgi:hypothetical protein